MAEYSAACSLDGEPFAPWNSTPFAPDDSCSGRMKGTFHRSPFGTMYAPSTDAHGEALLTWFREASPALTFPLLAEEPESRAKRPASGVKWPASLAKYDPASRSWKTAQLSLFGASEECSVTWPRSGMTAGGMCWPLPTLAPPTAGSGSGLWATPTARDWRSGRVSQATMDRNSRPLSEQVGGMLNPPWVEWLMGWPIEWTGCEPLETDKFHEWLRLHGSYSRA